MDISDVMMDIDLVYLWVNGNDPKWVAKRDAFIGKPSNKQENCKGRFADNDELKYSLRSVEKYAPWIRKIFIVTDDQVPEWLDTSNPKIRIVDHTEILPTESLPCFNSVLLEYNLHKIPDLLEHFIYANDDTLIGRPVQPDTFFAVDGLPMIYMKRVRNPYYRLRKWFQEKIHPQRLSLYRRQILNATHLVEKKYGKYYNGKPHHNMDAYLKSTLAKLHADFNKEISMMYSHHMRSAEDIQRILFHYVALAEKKGHLHYVRDDHSFLLNIERRDRYAQIEECNPLLFCMNDTERATDEDRRFASEYLNKRFPEKSRFEK